MAKAKSKSRRKPTTTNRAPSRRRKQDPYAPVKNGLYALLGGVGGAVVGGLLVRQGVTPTTAGVGVTVAGSVGTLTLNNPDKEGLTGPQVAALGTAAAGAGQLALVWIANMATKKKAKELADKNKGKGKKKRPNLEQGYPYVEERFESGRRQAVANADYYEPDLGDDVVVVEAA